MPANAATPTNITMMTTRRRPAALDAGRDRRRRAVVMAARHAHGRSARHEHEKIEGKPDRHHEGRGDAGDRDARRLGRCATTASRFVVAAAGRWSAGSELNMRPQFSGAERNSLASRAETGAPRLPQAVRM